MAPEQLRGDRAANGVASDVWSLGMLAYRLLCGRMPFPVDGLPFAEVVRRVLEQDPEPPRGVQPDLPEELGWILERALEKEPTRRYATVRDLLDDLRRHDRHEPVLARPPGAAYRVRKFVRRHRLALAVAGLLAAGLGTGAGFLLHGMREAEAGARNARRGADLARELARVTIGMFDAVDDTAASRDVRVHELLDRGQFAPGSLREPAVEFAVREVRGRVYAHMRRFAEARFEFDQAATLLSGRLEALDEVAAMEREAIFRARHGRLLAATGERERGEAMVRAAEAAAAGARPTVRIDVAVEACHLLVDAGRHEDLLRSAAELRDLARSEGQATVVARAEAMLADAASALGRHEEAVELSRGAWTTLRTLRSDADSATVAAFANHVRPLQQAGDLDEAEALYPDLVAATTATYGPTHEHALIVAGNQATLLLSRGKLKQALAALREVVQRYEARGGAPTSDHLAMVNNLGMVLYQGGAFDAAEPHLRRAAEFTGKLLDPRDPDGVSIRFNHAACLGAMKRWEAAKPVLLAEYAAAEAILPAGHATLRKMGRTLARLFEINGEPDAAKAWRPR